MAPLAASEVGNQSLPANRWPTNSARWGEERGERKGRLEGARPDDYRGKWDETHRSAGRQLPRQRNDPGAGDLYDQGQARICMVSPAFRSSSCCPIRHYSSHGPGAARSGNFVLTSVKLDTVRASVERAKPIVLARATANFLAGRVFSVAALAAKKGTRGTGWGVLGQVGEGALGHPRTRRADQCRS